MTDARDDLVARLASNSCRYAAESEYEASVRRIETDCEAATRIQQLTARVDELDEHCRRLGRGNAERYWEERWRDDYARLQAAEASLAEAERVMEPFAEIADNLDGVGDNAVVWAIPGETTAAAFRAARAWLDSRRASNT